MLQRRLVLAALVLLSLTVAGLEESFVHSDDGCLLEAHCNACLLQLATQGVTTEPFSLPQGVAHVERLVPVLPPALSEETPRPVSSRGPPTV